MNLFTDTPTEDRIAELQKEASTMKEAGFGYVWGEFLKGYLEDGEIAQRQFGGLSKFAGDDDFVDGQNEAIEKIANLSEYEKGWLSCVKVAHDKGVESVGDDIDLPDEQMNGFLDASQLMLESEYDLTKIAWIGPNQQETEAMNAFEMGKVAAFNDLVDLAETGATLGDCVDAVEATLGDDDFSKIASQEDLDYQLGVENTCYEFLSKVASVHGEYDLSGAYEDDVMLAVLEGVQEKIASHGTASYEDAVAFLSEYDDESINKIAEVVVDYAYDLPLEKAASEYDAYLYNEAVELLGQFDADDFSKIAEVVMDNVDEEWLHYKLAGPRDFAKKVKKNPGKYLDPTKYFRSSMAMSKKDGTSKIKRIRDAAENQIRQGGGALATTGLAAGGLAAGGVAAKRKLDQRNQEGGRTKKASVDEAINVLYEAGLLDD